MQLKQVYIPTLRHRIRNSNIGNLFSFVIKGIQLDWISFVLVLTLYHFNKFVLINVSVLSILCNKLNWFLSIETVISNPDLLATKLVLNKWNLYFFQRISNASRIEIGLQRPKQLQFDQKAYKNAKENVIIDVIESFFYDKLLL